MRSAKYKIAFLQGDAFGMQQQVDWAKGKPGAEDWLLAAQAGTYAYFGHIAKARQVYQDAMESAKRNDAKEAAAEYQADLAIAEAQFGETAEVRRDVGVAIGLAPGRYVKLKSALALAKIGDRAQAQKLADQLKAEFPLSTMVQQWWLPAIEAELALTQQDAAKAVEILRTTIPYDLGGEAELWPAYARGKAYLLARDGNAAAIEFQKILDHPGLYSLAHTTGALAHLGLARACVISGNKTKARAQYQDFLALWKDADPDVPILKQARAEYAKLK